MPNKIKQPE